VTGYERERRETTRQKVRMARRWDPAYFDEWRIDETEND